MRPIDGDALFDDAFEVWGNEADGGETNLFMGMINNAPTIAPPPNDPLTMEQLREIDGEPVKVVRCKDCKHLYFKDFSAFCPHRVGACRPDGFCEHGERRKPEGGVT